MRIEEKRNAASLVMEGEKLIVSPLPPPPPAGAAHAVVVEEVVNQVEEEEEEADGAEHSIWVQQPTVYCSPI